MNIKFGSLPCRVSPILGSTPCFKQTLGNHQSSTPCPRFKPLWKSSDTIRDCQKSRTITSRANHSLCSDFVHSIASSIKNFNLYEHIIVAQLRVSGFMSKRMRRTRTVNASPRNSELCQIARTDTIREWLKVRTQCNETFILKLQSDSDSVSSHQSSSYS